MDKNHPYYSYVRAHFLRTAFSTDGAPLLREGKPGARATFNDDEPAPSAIHAATKFLENFLAGVGENNRERRRVFRQYAEELHGAEHAALLFDGDGGGHRQSFWRKVGQNLALTAARHGAGFWDSSGGPATDRLTKAARQCGYNGAENWRLSARPVEGEYRGILRY